MQTFSIDRAIEMSNDNAIILFDGACTLCNTSVQFVLQRDTKAYFYFASLQSNIGKELLSQYGLTHDLSSIVLIEQEQAFFQSTAVLRIAKQLDGVWPVFYNFILIPPFFRDSVYTWIAKNRYQWFGRNKDICNFSTIHAQNRILS